ncbi:MAG: MBOAT family protein [Bdellovibrionales bacterium]
MILYNLDTALLLMVAFIAYVFTPTRWRYIFLLALSVGILSHLGWSGFSITLIQVAAAFIMGLWIGACPTWVRLWSCVLLQLAPMVFYKLGGVAVLGRQPELWGLPLGLSYYTFQMVSYLIEVYWGRQPVQRQPLPFFLYGLLVFNKVAGPIERPSLIDQFRTIYLPPNEKLYRSLFLIWLGYFQKGVIAENLAPFISPILQNATEYQGLPVLCAILLSKYQIFCDFSGASLLALGAAGLFGLDLTLNFDRPFAARSLREFWTRWHISLQAWIRDYVFYPLLSTRLATWGAFPLILVSFIIFGLWHDIRWTFALYGVLQAVLIWVRPERLYSSLFKRAWTLPLALIFNYVVLISLPGILFRARTLTEAWTIWSHIGWSTANWDFFIKAGEFSLPMLLALMAANECIQWSLTRTSWLERLARSRWYWRMIPVPFLLLVLILYFKRGELQPFVYSTF